LRPAGLRQGGWRLRGDAVGIELVAGVAYEAGEPRATWLLTLVGLASPTEGGRMRWKLSRDIG
jgi:hypothetical protein